MRRNGKEIGEIISYGLTGEHQGQSQYYRFNDRQSNYHFVRNSIKALMSLHLL